MGSAPCWRSDPASFTPKKGGGFADADEVPRLHYLEVPLLLQLSTAGLRKGGFVLEAGPNVGWLVAATDVSRWEPLDMGYAVGVGYQLKVGPYKFSSKPSPSSGHGGLRNQANVGIGLRYTGGLTDVEIASPSGPGPRLVRNNTFQLYLAYSRNVKMP